jgi:PhnB protein
MKLNPYLFFCGDCEAAFRFYQEVLGGEIVALERHRGTPAEANTPAEWLDKIIHARLELADNVLMGSDAPPQYFSKPQGYCVSISIDNAAEAERIFAALADGGSIDMPLEETFWAHRFGMLVDKFGTPWMINCQA